MNNQSSDAAPEYREVEITPRRDSTFAEDITERQSGRAADPLADVFIEVELKLGAELQIEAVQPDQQKPRSAKASRISGDAQQQHPIGRKNSAAYLQSVERGTDDPR